MLDVVAAVTFDVIILERYYLLGNDVMFDVTFFITLMRINNRHFEHFKRSACLIIVIFNYYLKFDVNRSKFCLVNIWVVDSYLGYYSGLFSARLVIVVVPFTKPWSVQCILLLSLFIWQESPDWCVFTFTARMRTPVPLFGSVYI